MKKIFTLLSFLALTVGSAIAQAPLLAEDFDFGAAPSGNLLGTAGSSWVNQATSTVLPIQYISGNSLTFPGLITTGGRVTFDTTGQDVSQALSAPVNSGSIYYSAIINVSKAKTSGDYFLHLANTTNGSTFVGRLFIRSTTNGNNFNVGISKNSGTGTETIYTTDTLNFNTNYFVVVKYTFNSGAGDDVAQLFLSTTSIPTTEPNSPAASTSGGTDATSIGALNIRQGASASAGAGSVDFVRVGTTWESVTTSSITLPAQIVNLQASIKGNQALVQWNTLTETNTQQFVVEKSNNGATFNNIGAVKAVGTGNHAYQFIDNKITVGWNYYRLVIVDNNGSKQYSKTTAVYYGDGNQQAQVFPTVVSDIAYVRYPAGKGAIQIINNNGAIVGQQVITNQLQAISTANLPAGSYIVKVIDGNYTTTVRIIK
ncbi:MAG: T9SS type A sorting domain-containing protein [Chitinophagaceae bacterium]